MNTATPRPILKRSPSACHENDSELPFYGMQAVHFPPSPSLSRFYNAHPSSIYDRSPIVVSANACALPERGCPGRTYTLDERNLSTSQSLVKFVPPPRGGHLHPRALNQRQAQSLQNENFPRCPPLIPDLSSESEESDGFISPPPETSFTSLGPNPYSHHADKYPSQLSVDNAVYFTTKLDNIQLPSPADPRRISHRDRDRIRSPTGPGEVAADDPGYEDDRDVPSSSRSVSPRKNRCRKNLTSRAKAGFDDSGDGGCLGGF
ncbi:hypothetical protein J3R30DRAFT_3287480 [Lentinula aciculospora]|uniref:Uncharacterized protein n=1 Tax=Lentinula aciculospora TaxID=153920 RepID=A0A9W9AFL7_9AGAR|nr:hypothetical protein J3R30DRAFT_3287480 [Lentinula aciculospora]